VTVTADAATILGADRVVFPGQGAIGDCMQRLAQAELIDVLRRALAEKPFLGICLGLQSLMTRSDEDGGTACLDVIPGTVRRFPADKIDPDTGIRFKIPHMGWNEVHWQQEHALTAGIASGSRFYFVHSYHVVPDDDSAVAARTGYVENFVSAVARDNIFATQFHPEKSQRAGLALLENFCRWDCG
ncbi:MAG: imidazole glycerol phosphate synthase subunit HisH, partial [Gammaproteobacteria bacterium]|nr:imidazole glycerol phosphate synthase subunit HisH [Gammaproteobacteria bacterium]